MRFLIIAAVLACAAAAPSGLLAAPYGHGLVGHAGLGLGYAAPLTVAHAGPALPTISPGDLAGAAIDAHVDATDHARASVDAAREYHDQASELQGQAVNAAEDHSWQAIDAVKTHEAQIDGAAAGVAPVLAKQIAGHAPLVAAAPVAAYGAHGIAAGYGAHGLAAGYGAHGLATGYAAHGLATGYAAHGLAAGYGAHGVVAAGYGAHGVVAAPALASSQTVVSQSLHQSHPAPVVHAPLAVAHAPLAVHHGAALGYSHGLAGHAW